MTWTPEDEPRLRQEAIERAEAAGGLSAEESRHVRMAVAAWLEGRRDAEFWLDYIHVTLGSPTADALKQLCIRRPQEPKD